MWDWAIIALVVLTALASAALPLAALRQWRGRWRLLAALPLAALLLWGVAVIALGHTGWPLQLFIWAMLTLVYMMALMTVRRMILKHREAK